MSVAENFCYDALRLVLNEGVEILKNYRLDWLKNPNTGNNLELDFYIPSIDVGFEVQGQRHYDSLDQKDRDIIKFELVKEHGTNLILLSISNAGKPVHLYNKLVHLSNKIGKYFPIKRFSDSWLSINLFEGYTKTIVSIYGKQECMGSPINQARKQISLENKERQRDWVNKTLISAVKIRQKDRSFRTVIFDRWENEEKIKFRLGGTQKFVHIKSIKLWKMFERGDLLIDSTNYQDGWCRP